MTLSRPEPTLTGGDFQCRHCRLLAGSSPSLPDGSNPSAAIVQSASDVQCSRLLKTTRKDRKHPKSGSINSFRQSEFSNQQSHTSKANSNSCLRWFSVPLLPKPLIVTWHKKSPGNLPGYLFTKARDRVPIALAYAGAVSNSRHSESEVNSGRRQTQAVKAV